MIDEGEARTAVDAALADWPPPAKPDEQVVVWKVDEHSQAWVVHVATRRWLRTQDFRDLLVGACPFVVEKATGQVHLYGSAPTEYAKFRAWLDNDDIDPSTA
ncbi:YrhB domain-containing protein [Kribbella sp. NPDC051936]|uniref:YrhB domain-containing protein n=1 Tax=Kribbella sp. NPDC051936 TaxID=3154946 RepID=UPI00341FCF48